MRHIKSRPVVYTIGLITINGLFFGLTNPGTVPSIMLIAGFGLVLATFYWLFYNLQRLAELYVPSLSKQKQLPATLIIVLGTLLALQSVGQLTFRDSLLIPLAATVFYMYTAYGKSSMP